MLLVGWYVFVRSKVPSFLCGGKTYIIEDVPALQIGLLLMAPLLVVFFLSFLLGYSLLLDGGVGIVDAIIVGVIINRVRKPVQPSDINAPPGAAS